MADSEITTGHDPGFLGTPAAKALGFETTQRTADSARMTLHCTRPAAQVDGDRVHPGAVLVAADQCLGLAVAGDRERHLVTLDLRLDFVGPIVPVGALVCDARSNPIVRRAVFVTGTVRSAETNSIVAHAVGQFLIGAPAGGRPNSPPRATLNVDTGGWSSFDDFLSLNRENDTFIVEPGHHRVGSLYLPAIHGGITAASLQQAMMAVAAEWQPERGVALISSATQYLSAGIASEALIVTVERIREGRSVALYRAIARHAGRDGTVAISQATFLVSDGANDRRLW